MKQSIALEIAAALLIAAPAFAADEEAAREKVKSELLLPECSWSKMSKEEYDECQKKRQTLKVMTPKERAKYLEHTEPNTIVVDDDGRRGERIITNRPARGGGGRR